MRFDSYLTEKHGSKSVDRVKLEKLLNDNCSDAMKSTPIYRGIESFTLKQAFMFVNPSKVVRKSAYAKQNIYMLLMSNRPNWSMFPPRNRSLPCSTSKEKAGHYSNKVKGADSLYRVYPFNGAKIGIASADDIWQSFEVGLGNKDRSLRQFNESVDYLFKTFLGYSAGKNITYENLIKGIEEIDNTLIKRQETIDKNKSTYHAYYDYNFFEDLYITRVFYDLGYTTKPREGCTSKTKVSRLSGKSLMDCLDRALDPKRNGFSVASVGSTLPKNREVWTDSPCLLVRDDYEVK